MNPRKTLRWLMVVLLVFIALSALSDQILTGIGRGLIRDETPRAADAVVVLSTGLAYYPRLMEAARLYRAGMADRVVLNGNRKSDALRQLEARGFRPAQPWAADYLSILGLLGVRRDRILALEAEAAYDTVSEAEAVGRQLLDRGYAKLIVTTSKSHTRRAGHAWEGLWAGRFEIQVVAAREDPFRPDAWWHDARQVREVLSEYGAWVYLYWKKLNRQV